MLHSLSLDEFAVIHDGYFIGYKESWEKVRITCFALSQYRTETDLKKYMPFEWDINTEVKTVEQSTVEDFEAMKQLINTLHITNNG